jgi:hypothetical protein
VPVVPAGRPTQRGTRQLHGVSALRSSSAHRRSRKDPAAYGRGHVPRALEHGHHARPARVRRPGDLPRARSRGAGQDRSAGGHHHRHGEHRQHSMRTRRHGLRVHGRQHGERGRRETLEERRAGQWRGPAAGGSLHLRWGAHAGGHPEPDADGQDQLRRGPDQRGHVAVRDHPRRPVHRRRGGQLRHAGRRLHSRAGGAALLHRAARHPADHTRGAAAGLQYGGAQPRARPPRRRRPAQGPARQGRQLPATAGRG